MIKRQTVSGGLGHTFSNSEEVLILGYIGPGQSGRPASLKCSRWICKIVPRDRLPEASLCVESSRLNGIFSNGITDMGVQIEPVGTPAPAVDAVAYYAQRWAEGGKENSWAMRRASVILDELARLGLVEPKILDFGCGDGWLTAVLSQFGWAEGADLAPASARKRYPSLQFHDASEPLLGPFDVIVSQEVLEHAEDQAAYLDLAYSRLRPGGHLILTTPNAAVSLRHPELLIQPIEHHLTRGQLRAALQSARFDAIRIYSFMFGYARWRPWRLQMRYGRQLNAGLHLIAVCTRA